MEHQDLVLDEQLAVTMASNSALSDTFFKKHVNNIALEQYIYILRQTEAQSGQEAHRVLSNRSGALLDQVSGAARTLSCIGTQLGLDQTEVMLLFRGN